MAVPLYDTDLLDITLSENITGWGALGGGGAGLGFGADFSMQGSFCVDKQVTAAEKGQYYTNTAITLAANAHIYTWVFLATPGLSNTLALRGLGIVIGSSGTAYNTFHVEGSDTYGAAGRVGKCYPVRYVTTANTGSVPYRTLTGSPAASPLVFGATANILSAVKSANLGVDAIRYGTGIYITAGALATPANFLDCSTVNDAVSARWGVLSYVGGGFELQGKLVIGQTKAYVSTPAYFEASNQTVNIVDTPHSLTDFSQIIIDNASSVFNLTNVTVKGLGTNNPGQLIYNNAGTVSALVSCTFQAIGISTLRAAVTVTGSTWTGSGLITPNGATLTNCNIASSTSTPSLIVNSVAEMAVITGGSFTGNVRSIKITTAGTYSFNGIKFSGNTYDIENSSAGLVTINASNGSNPTTFINTGGGTTTIVNAVAISVTVLDTNNNPIVGNGTSTGARVAIFNLSTKAVVLTPTYTNAQGKVTGSINYTADIPIYLRVRLDSSGTTRYLPIDTSGTITSSGYSITVTMFPDTIAK